VEPDDYFNRYASQVSYNIVYTHDFNMNMNELTSSSINDLAVFIESKQCIISTLLQRVMSLNEGLVAKEKRL
jgi:hypothetical protein